ncbi:MAG: 16S rRNA (uracil(1498)-N(3))-methyltransferase [Pseudomonadota bacterium]
MAHVPRLYVDQPLTEWQSLMLDRDKAHRLFNVMRLELGAEIRLFNGRAGEFSALISERGKRGGVLTLGARTRPQSDPPDLWLLFAPIKKERTDFIVEKATELGVARILPIITEHTNAERVRRDRLRAHAVAAAEQCGGTFVPPVEEAQRLERMLADWPSERALMFCDERATGGVLPDRPGPWAIVVGPEGGFSEGEQRRLAALGQTVSLGPRILRADTAVVAAIALWQAQLGDWR